VSKFNYGFMQQNSLNENNILWLSVEAGDIRMANVMAAALSDSVWSWHVPEQATQEIVRNILNRFGTRQVTISINSVDENHHTMHVVDFEYGVVSLFDDFNGDPDAMPEPKVSFGFMQYVQRFLK